VKRIVLAVVSFLALAVSAQPGDLYGGYSFERTNGDDAVSRHGWNASAAIGLTGSIALVADAGGHYGSSEGVDTRQLTLMAGPRFYYLRGDKHALFAQALAGLMRETASVQVLDVTIGESENRLGMLVGAGLDVKAGGRWWVRLSGHYEWSTKDGGSRAGFRAGVGAAYRF
jgi:hypothetical protein